MEDRQPLKRRGMLFGLGAVGAAAVAATAASALSRGAQDQPAADAQPKEPPPQGGGYRLSQHVLRYYETTKV